MFAFVFLFVHQYRISAMSDGSKQVSANRHVIVAMVEVVYNKNFVSDCIMPIHYVSQLSNRDTIHIWTLLS